MTAARARAPKAERKKVGRKPFVESTIAVRFTDAQLAAIDAAAGNEQRQRWIRGKLAAAYETHCDGEGRSWRAHGAARELLEVVRGVAVAEAANVVSVRFDAAQATSVVAMAEAESMLPTLLIREIALAAAASDGDRDVAKLASLAARLSSD